MNKPSRHPAVFRGVNPTLITIPITETTEQRKKREALGQPLPHYSFMVSNVDDKPKEEDDDGRSGKD